MTPNTNFAQLARDYGTPLFVYDFDHVTARYNAIKREFAGRKSLVCYAVKANSNLSLLAHLARLGAGFDCVSGGELARCLRAGALPYRVIYSGVGKTDAEIEFALRSGILFLNAESFGEVRRIEAVAARLGAPARLCVRVNPNVDAKTHPYISTGLASEKFGVSADEARAIYLHAHKSEWLSPVGVHFHIGSQLLDTAPVAEAAGIVARLVRELRAVGVRLKFFDIGGGLGVRYTDEREPDLREWAQGVLAALSGGGLGGGAGLGGASEFDRVANSNLTGEDLGGEDLGTNLNSGSGGANSNLDGAGGDFNGAGENAGENAGADNIAGGAGGFDAPTIICEPGRYLVANAGTILTRVVGEKHNGAKRFVIVDAAMTELIRPALYEASHEVFVAAKSVGGNSSANGGADGGANGANSNLDENSSAGGANVANAANQTTANTCGQASVCEVVGGVCESADFLAKGALLPPLAAGDLLGIRSAGAYGFSMASNYNSRLKPAEVALEGGVARLIRRRETFEQLVENEVGFL